MKKNAIVYVVRRNEYVYFKFSVKTVIETTNLSDIDIYCLCMDNDIDTTFCSDIIHYLPFNNINNIPDFNILFKFVIPLIPELQNYDMILYMVNRTEIINSLNLVFNTYKNSSKEIHILDIKKIRLRTLRRCRRLYDDYTNYINFIKSNLEKDSKSIDNIPFLTSDVIIFNNKEIIKKDNVNRLNNLVEFYQKYDNNRYCLDRAYLFSFFYSIDTNFPVAFNSLYSIYKCDILRATILNHGMYVCSYACSIRAAYEEKINRLMDSYKNAVVYWSDGSPLVNNLIKKSIQTLKSTSSLNKIDIFWLYINNADTEYEKNIVKYIDCTDMYIKYGCYSYNILPYFIPLMERFKIYKKALFANNNIIFTKDVSKLFNRYDFDDNDIIGIRADNIKKHEYNNFLYASNISDIPDLKNIIEDHVYLFNISKNILKFDYELKFKYFNESINLFITINNYGEFIRRVHLFFKVSSELDKTYFRYNSGIPIPNIITYEKNKSLSIYACCHKIDENSVLPIIKEKPEYYKKILCGAYKYNSNDIPEDYIRDDIGNNNISKYNNFINEWTGIWWIIHNLESIDSEYIGFCHYRRAYRTDFNYFKMYGDDVIYQNNFEIIQNTLRWSTQLIPTNINDKFYNNLRDNPIVKDALKYMCSNLCILSYNKNMFISKKNFLLDLKRDICPIVVQIMKNIDNGIANNSRYYGWLMECLMIYYFNYRTDLKKIRLDCIQRL